MNKLKTIILLSAVLLLGCKSEDLELTKGDNPQAETQTGSNKADVKKGVIRVKLTREVGDKLEVTGTSGQLRSGQSGIDAYLHELGAKTMTRVFPYAGKYEERTRREGLHLWYDITFDDSLPVTRAATDARKIPGIDIIEEVYEIMRPPYQLVMDPSSETRTGDGSTFTDPFLGRQWHYRNTGATPKSVAGADINLFKAWEIETGKPNVIVSVVDGGIDVTHEDITANMHINTAELNGTPDVDDDKNGFVDDIYGYNFVTKRGTVTADDHGTHVAGTVAARNNNGIGVCGVAGGNGDAKSGIRLLSCQIFEEKKNGDSAGAIKYGADNGAVISQNSWGYTYPGPGTIPGSIKAAIDYFIKYAGCDNAGNQLPNSPMKGGVVIFAAGNNNKYYNAYPAAYNATVSVSAMAPNWKKAWYSNYGEWVSIMAPGGDEFFPQGMVYSTVPGNKYAYMQGTSMACPHVSGIAALVVSKFGRQGFTNEELKKRIVTALRPMDIDAQNPDYKGLLGAGYIDAAKALATNQNKKPNNITNVAVQEDFTWLQLNWKAVSDADDETATVYRLYYSKSTLTASNYKNAEFKENIKGVSYKAGQDITFKLSELDMDTNYSFAMVAEDCWGLQSDPIIFSGKTKKNNPPILTRTGDEKVLITGTETADVKIVVKEPEGQDWTYTVTGNKTGVTVIKENDGIRLKFRALAPVGKYKLTVRVADIFNAEATVEVPFEVYENHPPKLLKEFGKLFIPVNKGDYTLNLAEYFEDEDGHAITYTVRSSNPSVSGATIKDGKLSFNPARMGLTTIEIAATDSQEAVTRANFQIQVVKDELVYIMYPVPVKTVLNVRLNDEVQKAVVTIRTTTGAQVYRKDVTASNSEQRLLQLDLSKLAGGSYILYAEANGKTYKQSFVKQ